MRRLLPILLLLAPLSARAQLLATAAEAQTLTGIHTVGLLIQDPSKTLNTAAIEQLTSSTQLELRKAGLRVVRVDTSDHNAANPYDALVQVVFLKWGRFAGDDVYLRFLVRQGVTLNRTQHPLWVTTWFTEQRVQNQQMADAAPRLLTQAQNDFLEKWLDANGR